MSAQITDKVVDFPLPRIERERGDGGWLVITPSGHAWLFGDRYFALAELAWHHAQWGRP